MIYYIPILWQLKLLDSNPGLGIPDTAASRLHSRKLRFGSSQLLAGSMGIGSWELLEIRGPFVEGENKEFSGLGSALGLPLSTETTI